MTRRVYWGKGGEYGPYSLQEDGWPHAGEVMQDYHKRSGLTAEEIAKRYSEVIKTPVTAEWIYKMEQRNKVPKDIDRRRALATILSIPPVLFGIASLEDITEQKQPVYAAASLKYAPLDLEKQTRDARWLWQLHYTNTAHDSLGDIRSSIQELETVERQARGDLLRSTCELLNSLYRLTATMSRDQGQFVTACMYANEAVRVAKVMGNDPYALQLLSASLFTRGMVSLAWGAFGHPERIEAALTDFEKA